MSPASLGARSDTLLLWVSERGSASWPQFRAAADELGIEPSRAARILSQLGHAEFDWHQDQVCAAPSALVALPGLDGYLLLTGSRPGDLVARIEHAIATLDLDATVRDPVGQHGPSTILVECDPADAPALADQAGVALESTAGRLAARLPQISVEWAGERGAPDERFPHAPVGAETLRPDWEAEVSLGAEGQLWWFAGHRRFEHYLRRSDGWWRFPTREYGPYLAYPDAPSLAYISAQQTLTCRVPLPPLHARCAALASGRLPYRKPVGVDGYEEWYVHVDPDTVTRIASSLGVPLPEREV